MAATFAILAVTVAALIWGRFSLDLVAIASLLALFMAGLVDLDEALAGFANPTVLLVGALFIVGEGLTRTGVTAWFGDRLADSSHGSASRLLLMTMLGAALVSSILANTATVAALMPAVVLAAWGIRSTPSKLLIPLAFAATAGGLLTLAGTAPNIVIAHVLEDAGERPFGFFEFGKIGLPLLAVMVLYMATAGRRLLPTRRSGDPVDLSQEMVQLADIYSLEGDLYRLRVRVGSPLIGSTLRESDLGATYGVSVLEIRPGRSDSVLDAILPDLIADRLQRKRHEPELSDPNRVIDFNDILIVRGPQPAINRLQLEMKLGVLPVDAAGEQLGQLLSQEIGIAEVLITPRSKYVGSAVAGGDIAAKDIFVLAARRGERPLGLDVPLQPGDSLLVRGTWEAIGGLADQFRDFVVVGRPEALANQITTLNVRSAIALASLAGMITLMVTDAVPFVIAAILAAGTMVAGGCLTMAQAYRSVSWPTVVLLAGMIPMSTALESSGGAEWVADALVESLGSVGPRMLLAGLMVLGLVSSQVIGNGATAVLLSPITLSAAAGLGVDPHPFLMGLAVACSTAFMAPLATAPNLLVMATGDYRFSDFLKVGTPLSLLYVGTSVVLIPLLWNL